MPNPCQIERFIEKINTYFQQVCREVPQTNSFDLIGTETSLWKYLVNEKGVVTIETQYNPPDKAPQIYEGVRRTVAAMFSPEKAADLKEIRPLRHFCLEGWLPVSVIEFGSNRGKVTEYALADDNGDLLVKLELADRALFFKTLMPREEDPGSVFQQSDPEIISLADGALFEQALARLKSHWQKKLAPILQWEFPHDYLKNAVLSAFVKTFLCQYAGALRYGATRYYCDTERCAESFPPTILTAVEACRFFGLQEEGERFFGCFLENFVTSRGEIIHRKNGASLSEHGMLLEQAAQASSAFQQKYRSVFHAVSQRLLELILPGELIACCPEDDLRDLPLQKWFSCNLWVIRGLEASDSFMPLGEKEKAALARFKSVVLKSCTASAVPVEDGTFIPPFPGWKEPFKDMNDFIHLAPEEDIHSLASYTNYRFYPEMLSSGILDPETVHWIIAYRKSHGGDFHGATAFRIFKDFPPYACCLDDWPLYNYLKGLFLYGEMDEFCRILAGHMAVHQSRGTFFAPEMSFRDKLDSTHCVPSQLIVPLALSCLLR